MAAYEGGGDSSEGSCTVEELMNIITHDTGGMVMLPSRALDLVYEGIYVGGVDAARDRTKLKALGITHVLNTAKGRSDYHVNTHPVIYENAGIKYLAIEATDMVSFPLIMHFEETGEFIHDARKNGGKVLIHCVEGVSRSATIAVAYLMTHERLTAQQAMREVRGGREVCPNQGFLLQLCQYNDTLARAGHFEGNGGTQGK